MYDVCNRRMGCVIRVGFGHMHWILLLDIDIPLNLVFVLWCNEFVLKINISYFSPLTNITNNYYY